MAFYLSQKSERREKFYAGLGSLAFVILLLIGVFAKNGWFPGTDPITEKTSGRNDVSTQPAPELTPQLSKEYIYAGSRLLAVEDARANAVWPADLAVWRPSSGVWWVMGGAAGSQAATQAWGLANDIPEPGDYDGDGRTDFSVYRPNTGEWYVLQSSNNTWAPVFAWGVPTDVRVRADYDGDGKTDRAVWRPSAGVWYIVRSSDGASSYQSYGVTGDVPAAADYDGDGRADLAVWRASEQKFYTLSSSNGVSSAISVASAGGQPVSADYDGDGRADYAVRNGANWIIRQSTNNQVVTLAWQQSTDVAVQNDYDGDGKCDIAVWRPVDSPGGTIGNWFIRQSASNGSLRQVQWGIAGDIPVPAFYRR